MEKENVDINKSFHGKIIRIWIIKFIFFLSWDYNPGITKLGQGNFLFIVKIIFTFVTLKNKYNLYIEV